MAGYLSARDKAIVVSSEADMKYDITTLRKARHRSEDENKRKDRLTTVILQELDDLDMLSDDLLLGTESLKGEYERIVGHLRRLAQVADGMYKTSEREKGLKESENASAKLRQKFQQHMRECDEKDERCKQTDTEDTMVTQNTSI